MPVYYGNKEAKNIYYGSTKIGEVYYGNTKVYGTRPLYYCFTYTISGFGTLYSYCQKIPNTVGETIVLYFKNDNTQAQQSSQLVKSSSETITEVTETGFTSTDGIVTITQTRYVQGDLYT